MMSKELGGNQLFSFTPNFITEKMLRDRVPEGGGAYLELILDAVNDKEIYGT